MIPIRVLIVEDSATVRERLLEVLRSDPEFDVVAVAHDGREAIELCETHRPDVVTMDMMLPIMSGLAATEHIMAYFPTPILVVSSSFNRGELFKMYDALVAGAVDVLEKPTGEEPPGEWEQRFLSTLRIVARIKVITHLRARAEGRGRPGVDHRPALSGTGEPARLVAIGASTGGPGAVVDVLRALPAEFDLPILFVLHINPQFGHAFADWLDAQTPWPCRFGRDGELAVMARGQVIIAPPGRHMVLRDGRIRIDDGPERFSCKPSVDVLFESVAADCGQAAIAALLTGMGRDGAAGLLAIRQNGGQTIAQDEATSTVYGMPRAAVMMGAAQRVLPLGEIGAVLGEMVRVGAAT